MRLRLFRLPACNQQVRQIPLRLIIVGSQVHRSRKLRVRLVVLLQLQVDFAQLVMRLGKARIHLQGIGILNGRFPQLALIAVPVAALQKLLLAHIRIARTPGKHAGDKNPNHYQAERNRTAHVFSKEGANAHTTTTYSRYPKGTAIRREVKVTAVIPAEKRREARSTMCPVMSRGCPISRVLCEKWARCGRGVVLLMYVLTRLIAQTSLRRRLPPTPLPIQIPRNS